MYYKPIVMFAPIVLIIGNEVDSIPKEELCTLKELASGENPSVLRWK